MTAGGDGVNDCLNTNAVVAGVKVVVEVIAVRFEKHMNYGKYTKGRDSVGQTHSPVGVTVGG